MKIEVIQVENDFDENINEIERIIRTSGEYLFQEKGLTHWSKPYTLDSIKLDLVNHHIYLIKDIGSQEYVHTFQLLLDEIESCFIIKKFATDPKWLGKGIGSKSLKHIERLAISHNIYQLELQVYDKSIDAIKFYFNKGFNIVGIERTKYFKVYKMKKILCSEVNIDE